MKIALVGRYGEGDVFSGPERVSRELFSKIRISQHQIIFVEYFFSDYKNSSFIKKIFGKEILSDSHVLRLGLIPLLKYLINNKFDLIHIVNHQRFTLPIFFIRFFIRSKLISTHHGLIKNEIPISKYISNRYFLDIWVEKLSLRKSDLLVFPSQLLRELVSYNFNFEIKKTMIIPNGVSSSFNEQRSSFPPIYDKINLVFYNGSGSFINRGLIELLSLLEKVQSRIKLYVIGSKVETATLKNIENEFVEPMDHNNLVSFLKDKHFLIKGPAYDSFSIFIIEGMACGVIPIVNEKIGINDFINHEVNGFKYNSESLDDLPNLLNRIAEGKYDLQKISADSKKIYNDLNWDKIAKKYLQAYKLVL